MTDQEVWREVTRWLNAKLTPTVIQAHQSAALPPMPFVMVNLISINEVREWPQTYESDEVDEADETDGVLATPVIETEWNFSIHAFGGPSPSDILRPLRSMMYLDQMTEPLWPGLDIYEMSLIRNIPEATNEGWEKRAQMDMAVRGLVRDGHVVDTIETVTVRVGKKSGPLMERTITYDPGNEIESL